MSQPCPSPSVRIVHLASVLVLLGCGAATPRATGPERTAVFGHVETWSVCTSAPNVASRFDEVDGTRTIVLYGRGTEAAAPFARVRFEPTAPVEQPIHVCDADARVRVETNARVISAGYLPDLQPTP